jgi:hypothetical protein
MYDLFTNLNIANTEAQQIERARKAGADFDPENPPDSWTECDCCCAYHPETYYGECRDDAMRWPSHITAPDEVTA